MLQIKQSTAVVHIPFLMVDSTDHVTGKTGLTVTVTLSKNAAAFGAASGAVTEISGGWYKLAANATDSNTLGALALHATATGADPTDFICANIVAYDPQDAVRAGLTAMPNVASGSAGAIVTSGTGTAQLSTSSGLVTLAGVTHTGAVIPTVTTITNLPAITPGWLTAAGIAASALNGKGDWNVGKAGYSLTPTTGLGNQTADITGNLSGSVGSVTGAVGSVTGAVGSVTGNVGGNVTGSVGSVAAGGITASSFGAGAIDAAALAADAGAEIADAVWDEAIAGHLGAGSTGAALNGATAPTAAAVADAVWDEALSGHLGAGSTGEALNGASAPTAAAVADAVWDEVLSGHLTAGTTGNALNAAGSAGDPWSTAIPGAYGAGTAGKILGDNIDAAISSRMATYTQPTGFLAATFPTTVASPTNITAATGVVLSGVTHTGAVIPTVSTLTGHTPQTGDAFARLGAPAGASVSADVAAVKTDTGNLVTRITATLFSGITSLAQWLGLLAGKQAANATALTEIKATGAGSGTYNETTDSLEALRDRGDAAWITATGFSTLDAAGVRTAVGLASANLDTQLSAIKSDTAATLVDTAEIGAAGAGLTALASAANLATVDAVADAIKAKTDSLTFTKAGEVDANVQSINDVTITGNGQAGTEFGV